MQQRPERPTLKVIDGGRSQPISSGHPDDIERLLVQLREAGTMLAAQITQLRERLDQAELQAELALVAERFARNEVDQAQAQLDGRRWSLWRRLLWAIRGH